MKNFIQAATLAFFLYLVPLLLCLEKDQSVSKSIDELNTLSLSSTDKYIQEDLQTQGASATPALNNTKKPTEPVDNELSEFNEITNFLEMNSKNLKSKSALANKLSLKSNKAETKLGQSFDLYKMRIKKMRKKKEIIVKKVFEIFPLMGEILGLADVEKIHLIINKFFLIRETELLAKFITMWDTNVNFTHHSAKVLLNLLLCNSRFNKLRCILNLLMEGLCKGDPRSIRIFKEIVTTVIIDTIMKTNFKYFNDIQAKFNLIRLFNVGFVFPPMVKIQFLEKMLISEKLKELVTFMILKLKSKEEIEILMTNNLHEPVPTLINYNDTSLLHDERMMPKFIGLREKVFKAGLDKDASISEKDIEEYYNLENLLNENKLNSQNNLNNDKEISKDKINKVQNEANLVFEDKDDVLSLSGADGDPDYDSDLFVDNDNQNGNSNKEAVFEDTKPNSNGYYHPVANSDQVQISSSIRRIVPRNNPAIHRILNSNIHPTKNKMLNSENFMNSKTLSRSDALKILEKLKLECDIRQNESVLLGFSEKSNKIISNKLFSVEKDKEEITYLETKLIEQQHLPYSEKQKIKLSEIKEQIKNEYNQMLYNMTYQPMPELEEYIPHFQVGISKRTIYPKYKKHLENLLKLNDLLDEFPISMPRGSIDVSSPKAEEAVEPLKPIVVTKNVNGVNVSMQFREKQNKDGNFNSNQKGKDNFSELIQNSEFRFKSLMRSKAKTALKSQTNICLMTTKETDFATKSLEQLSNFRFEKSPNRPRLPRRSGRIDAGNNYKGNDLNSNFQNPNNFNDDTQNNSKEIADITENIGYNMPEVKNIVRNPNRNIKVLFPKEIHTTYQVTKHGMKTIEINKDNPTKKMIIERLLPEEAFDDFMNQQEKPAKEEDPTGLFNILKNIQNRKCSCGFLCIEIGAIYGDFSDLNPRNITVPYNTNKNVHFVIKPIVIVNNTEAPYGPINPNEGGNSTNWNNLFLQDEDCDDLKMMGISSNSPSNNNNNNNNFNQNNNNFNRFKETGMSLNMNRQSKMTGVNFNKMQRKFYRKVAIAEEIYSQDTFKQGLNMIIIQRDKKYTKLFEKTFDTNNSRKESDEMADILRDTPCSKIIVLTGIGKWIGAMTPALIKEIKQIGGPDLNNLYSPDEDDNSMADHSFILVGRRGLCRYNGIFRIKNYDLSRQMQKLFPDSTSDPNDCYFDDVSLENQKNKSSEKQFFHTIDLRLTLNINNDNRFAWDAPTVSQVSPFRGSIHGGQEIKIGGFNFGSHTTDLKEILVGGVICGDFINLSPNLLSCVTRGSTILGPGPKNIIIKLRNGFESPARTCNVFEYIGDTKEALDDLKTTINTVNKMKDLPIYMNSNYHDQDISLFDHLKFNNRFYKEKLKPDHNNHVSLKLDSMVKANYNELIDVVNGENGLKPKMTGLRRKRFSELMTKLENCDKK